MNLKDLLKALPPEVQRDLMMKMLQKGVADIANLPDAERTELTEHVFKLRKEMIAHRDNLNEDIDILHTACDDIEAYNASA